MQRSWLLMGQILEQIERGTLWEWIQEAEENAEEKALLKELNNDPAEPTLPINDRILRHLELLQDAGYIKDFNYKVSIDGRLYCGKSPIRITMAGYDLKEVINDAKLFNQIKAKAKSAGVKLSWEFIKAAIPVVIKGLL